MKGCHYDYTFTLPSKEFKEQKALNMKDLCIAIRKDLEEHYYIDDVTINNQVPSHAPKINATTYLYRNQ